MLLLATVADAHWNGLTVVAEAHPEHDQRDRIIEALGLLGEHLPRVDEETALQVLQVPDGEIVFPFTAHYPAPRPA